MVNSDELNVIASQTDKIQVILADDHELFRDGFKGMIKKSRRVEIVAEASNGVELVQAARKYNPHVIVTDIKMPLQNGIDATIQIKKEMPHIEIIALTMFEDELLIVDMLQAGASGYLLKNAHKNEILAAIEEVYHHKSYYCKGTTVKLAKMIAESTYNPNRVKEKPAFNDKELAVIRMICEECSNQEIAENLELSKRTIESYRDSLQKKMKVRSTAGIVVFAIKNKLFELSGLTKL